MPGGPIIPIHAIISAVNERNETAEVAAAFDKAVAAGFIPQLIAQLKQVRPMVMPDTLSLVSL